jgi:hypothetical protein
MECNAAYFFQAAASYVNQVRAESRSRKLQEVHDRAGSLYRVDLLQLAAICPPLFVLVTREPRIGFALIEHTLKQIDRGQGDIPDHLVTDAADYAAATSVTRTPILQVSFRDALPSTEGQSEAPVWLPLTFDGPLSSEDQLTQACQSWLRQNPDATCPGAWHFSSGRLVHTVVVITAIETRTTQRPAETPTYIVVCRDVRSGTACRLEFDDTVWRHAPISVGEIMDVRGYFVWSQRGGSVRPSSSRAQRAIVVHVIEHQVAASPASLPSGATPVDPGFDDYSPIAIANQFESVLRAFRCFMAPSGVSREHDLHSGAVATLLDVPMTVVATGLFAGLSARLQQNAVLATCCNGAANCANAAHVMSYYTLHAGCFAPHNVIGALTTLMRRVVRCTAWQHTCVAGSLAAASTIPAPPPQHQQQQQPQQQQQRTARLGQHHAACASLLLVHQADALRGADLDYFSSIANVPVTPCAGESWKPVAPSVFFAVDLSHSRGRLDAKLAAWTRRALTSQYAPLGGAPFATATRLLAMSGGVSLCGAMLPGDSDKLLAALTSVAPPPTLTRAAALLLDGYFAYASRCVPQVDAGAMAQLVQLARLSAILAAPYRALPGTAPIVVVADALIAACLVDACIAVRTGASTLPLNPLLLPTERVLSPTVAVTEASMNAATVVEQMWGAFRTVS